MLKRIFAFLLTIAVLVGITACKADITQKPTEPTEAVPPEITPEDLFREAVNEVDDAENLILNGTIRRTKRLREEELTEETELTLNYLNYKRADMIAYRQETSVYNDREDRQISYSEVYSQKQVYARFSNAKFVAYMKQEDYIARQYPAVLISVENYETIDVNTEGSSTILSFSQPTAIESWAAPEHAKLISAEGTVTLDAEGHLLQSTYTASFRQNTVTIELSVEMNVELNPKLSLSSHLPKNESAYIRIDDIDTPRRIIAASADALALKDYTVRRTQIMASAAIGQVIAQNDVAVHSSDGVYKMLYENSTNIQSENSSYEWNEKILDNQYTFTVDGELKQQENLTNEKLQIIDENIRIDAFSYITGTHHMNDIETTDTGDCWVIDYTADDEEYSDYLRQLTYYEMTQSEELAKLSESYTTTNISGYLSIDKDSGLLTAAGLSYGGVDVIEGRNYALAQNVAISFDLASLSAYKTITGNNPPEEQPEKKATPLFYHVTGKNGEEMWLLGTIHVGDARTGFLPQEIYDAFDGADALAVEFDVNALEEQLEEDEDMVALIAKAYYYDDGSTVKDHISEEIYEDAVIAMKKSGNYSATAEHMRPSTWSDVIESFYQKTGTNLTSEQGMDMRLLNRAEEQGKEIRNVESAEFQIQMSASYSDTLQECLLESTLSGNRAEYADGLTELYEMWCSGDEAALIEEITEEIDTDDYTEEELAIIEEYNNAMMVDRNKGMVSVAIDYLNSGDTVFYAVGLAHLLGEGGLVEELRAAGYTVDLVTYK